MTNQTPKKRVLLREIADLLKRNKDGSFSTQSSRKDVLILSGKQLMAGGFRGLGADSLKPKHIRFLIERWKEEGLTPGTLKNRISHLRWWTEKIGKQNIIPRTNSALGIERRKYVTNQSKAVDLSVDALAKINDERLRASLKLQAAFGLRREECLKFQPQYAMSDGADKIQLKASWCKGGRAREIPITNDFQREALAEAARIAGEGSMIPKDKNYRQQMARYDNLTARAGLSNLHGLRHAYAQKRYQELTGWAAPAAGGSRLRQLSEDQRKKDHAARMQISSELGHGREAITAVYLGR